VPVDGLGDLTLEGPQGFLGALALVELASVVGPSRGVVADLGHGGDVESAVELPVAARVEPVTLLGSAGRGDGGAARVAGVAAAGREPVDVAGVAEDDRGAEGPDAVNIGHRGARYQDGFDDAFVNGDELAVEPADIAEQIKRDALALDLDGVRRMDRAQDPPGALS
jgi:hypothetical protein